METIAFVVGAISVVVAAFFAGGYRRKSQPEAESEAEAALPPANGVYVEVDCRNCLQFNRVPLARLRDRPHCGRCKALLAPKRRLTICKVTSRDMDADLSSDLDRVWTDPDRLWHRVAEHLAAPRKTVN